MFVIMIKNDTSKTLTMANLSEVKKKQYISVTCFSSKANKNLEV